MAETKTAEELLRAAETRVRRLEADVAASRDHFFEDSHCVLHTSKVAVRWRGGPAGACPLCVAQAEAATASRLDGDARYLRARISEAEQEKVSLRAKLATVEQQLAALQHAVARRA